jgi:hypothetical protein
MEAGMAGRGQPYGVPKHVVTRTIGTTLLVVVAFAVGASFTHLIPDSAGYLSWGRSLLWDGDIHFGNEYAAFGMIDAETNIRFGAATATGLPGNPFGMGTALLWMPFLVLARLMAALVGAFGGDVATNGFGTGTWFSASLGTWAFVLVAWQLVDASIRLAVPHAASRRLALATAFLAMPLPYYTLQLTTYSHAASVLAISLVLYFTLRWRVAPSPRHGVIVGLLLALATLVRVQNAAFLALPACVWFGALRRTPGGWRVGSFLVLAMLLGVVPQALAWGRLYGSVFAVPQGEGFVALSFDSLVAVLLSPRHGLLTTAPIVLVTAILLGRHRSTLGRPLVIGVVTCFVLQWLINAVPVDWWAGWSFGARRFCNLIPLLAVVLATARGRVARGVLVACLVANLVQWLRLASRHLPGDGDPGFSGLWGSEFLAFVAKVPEALWRLATTRWDEIAVLARPGAHGLQIRPDPAWFLAALVGVWLLAVLAGIVWLRARLGLDAAAAGNSRRAERV